MRTNSGRQPMARATIDDVAELAGVSIKNVSPVVNQEPNVREETRTEVGKAIAQLKYRPNLSARNLASQRTRDRRDRHAVRAPVPGDGERQAILGRHQRPRVERGPSAQRRRRLDSVAQHAASHPAEQHRVTMQEELQPPG